MLTMISRYVKSPLRRVSAMFQTAQESFRSHDAQYRVPGKLEMERAVIAEYMRVDMINGPQFRLGTLLAQHPGVRSLAVDIGAGTGWVSGVLSKYFQTVLALEPSAAALEIAQHLYPHSTFGNIEWRHGFAEDLLAHMDISQQALFITGVVLSHLRDREAQRILHFLSKAPKGSILAFNEAWGEESHRLRWHVRTKSWWSTQLPGWKLNFHGAFEEGKTYALGFHGVKVD